MTFPILGGNGAVATYSIDNSLRFNDNDSARLTKTFSSGNRKTWTWSAWIKRASSLGSSQSMFGCHTADTDTEQLDLTFNGSNQIQFEGKNTTFKTTSKLFRDVSAWYHIMFVLDMTQSTSDDRMKIYVNGEQETSFATDNTPAQNTDLGINQNSQHAVGMKDRNTAQFFDGYMAEVHFIDGTAKSPTDFGEFDEDSGIWKPIQYTGSYGTNGFYLDFENSGSLGADQSGNGNNFTPTNLASTDQTTDTPTNNFCTFNPLARNNGNTYTEGNTVYDYSNNYQKAGIGSQTFSSGKWYAEFKANGSEMPHYGIAGDTYHSDGNTVTDTSGSWNNDIKGHTGTIVLQIDGTGTRNIWADGSDTGTDTDFYAGTGDIVMIAFDADTGKIWFGKNGTWSSSGNPATGSNPTYTYSGSATKDFTFAVSTQNNSSISANFGNPSFSISSGNTDDNGYGNFEYAPPSGYLALCTQNLATELSPTIDDGSAYFHTQLYTGTGSALSITNDANAGDFQPDWIWLKSRSNATNHNVFDSSRGETKRLYPNLTDVEDTVSGFTLDSNGFSTGTSSVGDINVSSQTYVAWQWKANGGTTSSNTDGSITSTVQANTTAGFSIVTYAGNSTTGETLGHGLGVSPAMFIIKDRTGVANWVTWNKNLPTDYNVYLNTTDAQFSAGGFAGMGVTSSVIQLPTGGTNSTNTSGQNYVCYAFAEIEGYSKFGSYTGNGSTDGTFVYTGFRPAFVIIKRSSDTENWNMYDSARNTYNPLGVELYPNLSNAESSTIDRDFLSNGFKLRSTNAGRNASGSTYIYMAFAENPFVSSSGVPVVAR